MCLVSKHDLPILNHRNHVVQNGRQGCNIKYMFALKSTVVIDIVGKT